MSHLNFFKTRNKRTVFYPFHLCHRCAVCQVFFGTLMTQIRLIYTVLFCWMTHVLVKLL